MAILKFSSDYGASIYHNDCSPDIDNLTLDGRIRETYDPNDLSAGDYTYSRDDQTFRLTGTGEILWVWDGQMFTSRLPQNEPDMRLTLASIANIIQDTFNVAMYRVDRHECDEAAKRIVRELIISYSAKF